MTISFIIPAHNEETVLGPTLDRLRLSARDCLKDDAFEIIVVNDASTDRTEEVARQRGAQVVSVNLRQIAAVRNAGARKARGEVLFFVDADTLVPEERLRSALDALAGGAIGGGARVEFDERVPRVAKVLTSVLMWFFVRCRFAAGCFIFCTRRAFDKAGGFDERFFASEEIWISQGLKQQGRFLVVREPVITSGRKVRMHGLLGLLWQSIRIGVQGVKGVQRREGLDLWYDGRRESTEA